MSTFAFRIGDAHIAYTGRDEGDLGAGADPELVIERRRGVVDLPFVWARQVHGADVVVVDAETSSGMEADALVTTAPRVALATFTADCAPIGLVGQGPDGLVIAAVHGGWRGLVGGVVANAAATMRRLGATEVAAAVGPSVHPECYAFSPADLDYVASRLNDDVRATTRDGEPALSIPNAVRSALLSAGVRLVFDSSECTACSPDFFSYRARGEVERQAMVIWRE